MSTKHAEPIEVKRFTTSGEDRGGNPIKEWAVVDTVLCMVAPGLGSDVVSPYKDGIVIDFTLYLPNDHGIQNSDRLIVRGDECKIEGVVANWHNPKNGRRPGGVVHVRKVEGA